METNFNKMNIEGRNNDIISPEAEVVDSVFKISGSHNKIIFKKASKINKTTFEILGDNNYIEVDENCQLETGYLVCVKSGCRIAIGENSEMKDFYISTYDGSSVTIGKNCLFSLGIELRSGDGHSIIDIKTGQTINPPENIVIKDHVWLCRNVKVLKGVIIGKDCIIGHSSVCTKSLPDNCLAAGIPAKIKKKNVSWSKEYK